MRVLQKARTVILQKFRAQQVKIPLNVFHMSANKVTAPIFGILKFLEKFEKSEYLESF